MVKSLLTRAKQSGKRKDYYTPEMLVLALAYFRGEVNGAQVAGASKLTRYGAPYKMAKVLRHAIITGQASLEA